MNLSGFLVLLCHCLVAVSALDPVVDLGYSKYRGRIQKSGVGQWLGIRFAAPPVGSLRFSAPQDPVATKGIQPADKVSNRNENNPVLMTSIG